MKIVYRGPSPEVVIIIEGGGIHAPNGEPIDVPDDLGKSLCEQATFEEVKTTHKKKKPADPAAPVESAAEPQEEI
jgi:hypothetical protein